MLDTKTFLPNPSSWASSSGVPMPDPTKASRWNDRVVEHLVDFLGASASIETYEQTSGYRWRGQDTLTWGNPNEWVVINWMRNIMLGDPGMEVVALSKQIDLWCVLQSARITNLEHVYTFRQAENVKGFLFKNPTIVSVIIEAKTVLEKFFGPDIHVSLEVVSDPETKDNTQLFGYIQTGDMLPDVAFECLNAMDEAWFIKQFDLTSGLFNFSLE
jgi:hypothetical protein